jgi:NADH-ubiquinone oxidoreductase chain 6
MYVLKPFLFLISPLRKRYLIIIIMNSEKYLFLLNEIYTNGYTDYILDIISGLAVISGISVIISKNPIVSVLHLIALFAYVSFYLIIIGLNFIGLSYLIVYIGAVSILFLFILMLINIRTSELQSNTSNSIPLTILIGIVISYFLFQMLPYGILISSHLNDSNLNENLYTIQIAGGQDNNINGLNADKNDLFFITSKIWDGNLAESNHITAIGNVMYTNYNIWLIIASFILLLAMVGAIVITIKPRKN